MKQKIATIKFWKYFCWMILILALIPLLWIANFNHSMSDDWVYGIKLHEVILQGGFHPVKALKAVVDWVIHYWHGWQGTYAAIFLFQLQPAIWGEEFYRCGTYILALCVIFSTAYFFRMLFTRLFQINREAADLLTCLVLLLWFELMPSPVQGLYWWNGASYYVIFFAILLYLCGCLLKIQTEQKCSGLRLVFLTIVVFFLAGGNFITALLAAEILFANLLICLFQKNKLRLVAAVLFVVNLGGFLLSAFAPGNAFRQAEYEQFSPFKAIVYSFSEAYIVYCTLKIPKVAEGNPKSCMRIFPIIADAFGISLRPQ